MTAMLGRATDQNTHRVPIIPKLIPVFSGSRGSVRYRGAHGGRGSGKSRTFATMAALWGYREPLRILATREFQGTIRESFYAELRAAIVSIPWMRRFYRIREHSISGLNGTEFIFRGLRHNIQSIRSLARVDICIIEEAEDVPDPSWGDLVPTIRSPQSEIWALWNPKRKGSPVDDRLRQNFDPERMIVAEVNWRDNPWFPEVLEEERRADEDRLDFATYQHIWEGAYLANSAQQVLADKVVIEDFKPGPDWQGPRYGADWGFAQDPTVLIKLWSHDGILYVEHEAYQVGCDIDATPALFDAVPGARSSVIRGDSARPETISYLRRNGYPGLAPVVKWAGSVQDGIQHLRAYRKIVIHPRCVNTIREATLYSYRLDRSGRILPEVVDAYNHCWDAIRYADEPYIRRRTDLLVEFL